MYLLVDHYRTRDFGPNLPPWFLLTYDLQLEDPFGYDKADIKVDAIVEDLRVCILQFTSYVLCETRMLTGKKCTQMLMLF